MTKTLAQLKRDLQKGTKVTLVASKNPGHRFMNLERYVVKTQGNGVYLNEDKNATTGSFMDFPKKATLMDYVDDTFTIYRPGYRELTAEEKKVMDTMPSHLPENAKQCEIDMMTDGSQMYWADRRHTKEHGMEHLDGFEVVRGLKYDFNTKKVLDETIKGELELQYKLN